VKCHKTDKNKLQKTPFFQNDPKLTLVLPQNHQLHPDQLPSPTQKKNDKAFGKTKKTVATVLKNLNPPNSELPVFEFGHRHGGE